MNVAVRYCSLHGNTKAIAEEIAEAVGVEAVSINDEPELKEHTDVLFLGGAPYWSIMDPALEEYAKNLQPSMVGTVVLFTTSNWSRRTAIGLRDIFEKRGITVAPGHFYAHMSQIQQRKNAAREFAKSTVAALEKSNNVSKNTGLIPELKTEAVTVGAIGVGVVLIITALAMVFRKRRYV